MYTMTIKLKMKNGARSLRVYMWDIYQAYYKCKYVPRGYSLRRNVELYRNTNTTIPVMRKDADNETSTHVKCSHRTPLLRSPGHTIHLYPPDKKVWIHCDKSV